MGRTTKGKMGHNKDVQQDNSNDDSGVRWGHGNIWGMNSREGEHGGKIEKEGKMKIMMPMMNKADNDQAFWVSDG